MSAVIVRGGTCRLIFRPEGGLNVNDLGTPSIAVEQELTFLTPEVIVDVPNNRIYADLTEEDTIQLVEGLTTRVQAVFTDDETEAVYRFPIHQVTVIETLFGQFFPEEEEEEQEEEPQVGE